MNKYAIIKIGPFQYTVEEGMEYSVPKFDAAEGKKIDIADVLAVGDDKGLSVGMPNVSGGKVTLEILEQGLGKKVDTRIYKAKSRYRKAVGHRPRVTKFKVAKISVGKGSSTGKVGTAAKTKSAAKTKKTKVTAKKKTTADKA